MHEHAVEREAAPEAAREVAEPATLQRPSAVLALQRSAGNRAVGHLLRQTGALPAAGQESAARAAYIDSLPRVKERFMPSTGMGLFDVILSPGILMLHVKSGSRRRRATTWIPRR